MIRGRSLTSFGPPKAPYTLRENAFLLLYSLHPEELGLCLISRVQVHIKGGLRPWAIVYFWGCVFSRRERFSTKTRHRFRIDADGRRRGWRWQCRRWERRRLGWRRRLHHLTIARTVRRTEVTIWRQVNWAKRIGGLSGRVGG